MLGLRLTIEGLSLEACPHLGASVRSRSPIACMECRDGPVVTNSCMCGNGRDLMRFLVFLLPPSAGQ